MGVNCVTDRERDEVTKDEAEELGTEFDAAIDTLTDEIIDDVGEEFLSRFGVLGFSADGYRAIAHTDEEAAELARPMEAAQALKANWGEWDLGDCNFADPESMENWDELPDEAKAVLKYVASSDNLLQALDAPEAKEKTDGKITKHSLGKFIDASRDDRKAATDAYDRYLKNNPDADNSAKALAKSAALLAANQTLIAASGDAMAYDNDDRRKNNKGLHGSNLDAVINDPTMPKSLQEAAALWRDNGMNSLLDTSSEAAAVADADRVIGREDITSWLENTSISSDADAIELLNSAATRSAVADVNTDDLDADVLAHPEKYDGSIKAAVLLELLDSKMMMQSGIESGLWDDLEADANHLNPNTDKVAAELDEAIATLSADADVQKYLSTATPAALADIVSTNSSVQEALQGYMDGAMTDGTALKEALATTDADGNKLSTADALMVFVTDACNADIAMGGDGNPDLSKVADKAGLTDTLKAYFNDELKSGKALQEAIDGGADPEEAAAAYQANVAAARMVLGDTVSDQDLEEMSANYSDIISDALLEKSSAKDLEALYGDENGELDEEKVKAAFEAAVEIDPSLAVAADGSAIKSEDVVKAYKAAWDMVRKGEKLVDALPKAIKGLDVGSASDAYKSGLSHGVAALMGAGYIAAKAIEGGAADASSITVITGAAAATTGTIMESGSKYAKFMRSEAQPYSTQALKQISVVENAGKILGNVGGAIGSAFSIASGVGDLKNGNIVTGAFSVTSGVLGAVASAAGIAEGIAGLVGSGSAAALGVAASSLGVAAGGFALIGALIAFGIADYKKHKAEDDFLETLGDDLNKYGITGGERVRGDSDYLDGLDDEYDEPLIGS